MFSEISSERESYRRRLEVLQTEFREKLRVRDEARTALSGADERIESLQREGISILGNLNTAVSESEGDKLKELERNSRRNTRDLARAQKHRERQARKLEAVEFSDEEAVGELKRDSSKILDEYAGRVEERKRWLSGVAENLDEEWTSLAREAAPLTGEYEPGRAGELPAAKTSPEEG